MKILFICTHNRCRSILSEAIARQVGQGLLDVRSAGSAPIGAVHPLSIKYLEKSGFDCDGLQSQSWDEFEDFAPDVVITVCDTAAGESCPLWFGKAIKIHWGLQDPSKLEGSDEAIEQAFLQCIDIIKQRSYALLEVARKAPSVWSAALQELSVTTP